MNDTNFFLASLILWLLLLSGTVYLILKQKQTYRVGILSRSILNIGLCIIISSLWFYSIAIDGISHDMGYDMPAILLEDIALTLNCTTNFSRQNNSVFNID
ncbi:uncharacterized protein with PQ loop repeat [Peribacillus deserti]|uniref:Uncharacterized protein with PQ loop repeat n=1 Tax=Peribacillus deserti TaxID=673318 RepID=A0ABS2QM65_9BACI|nr:hypothetical protein [Peribacillus deserti]MBM7694267.1 uncharacterized protein with PQ loop repeat [Peribacillus deserti]